ncbi:unnamed protein product, partial [Brassica rapa]
SHIRPVCADGHTWTSYGHTQTHTDSHGRPVCADGHPRTSCVWTHTDVLCVLLDTHGRPVSTEQTAHVGQNHPNSPREALACCVQGPAC